MCSISAALISRFCVETSRRISLLDSPSLSCTYGWTYSVSQGPYTGPVLLPSSSSSCRDRRNAASLSVNLLTSRNIFIRVRGKYAYQNPFFPVHSPCVSLPPFSPTVFIISSIFTLVVRRGQLSLPAKGSWEPVSQTVIDNAMTQCRRVLERYGDCSNLLFRARSAERRMVTNANNLPKNLCTKFLLKDLQV